MIDPSTPDGFKAAREYLGLTQRTLGGLLGVDQRTIRRWEQPPEDKSGRPPNPVAARVMEWLIGTMPPPQLPLRKYGVEPGANG